MKVIIADASCLIVFEKIKQFTILQKTFREIFITEEVSKEFGSDLPKWIKIIKISNEEVSAWTKITITL